MRIDRYAYERGQKAPSHDHPTGVQILLTDVHARQTTPDGKTTELTGERGTVRMWPAFTHAIENAGERFEGILVDLKGAPAPAPGR